MVNIASKIPKKMHENVLRKLLSTFPTDELETLIEVIKEEQIRRAENGKDQQ
jgi:hypothetical protein